MIWHNVVLFLCNPSVLLYAEIRITNYLLKAFLQINFISININTFRIA